jgi:hypothetical protein
MSTAHHRHEASSTDSELHRKAPSMTKHRLSLPSSRASLSALLGVRTRLERPPLVGALLMLALLLAVAAGMFQLTTPAVAPRTAPGTAFSAARAMQHLEEIAREPHPIGSPANERARLPGRPVALIGP